MTIHHERERVLIWGKTYPELSSQYTETVCTAGVRADGRPIRLYPVPLRYLEQEGQFRLYDWVDVPIAKSTRDGRPESYKVDATAIRCVGHIEPDGDGWRGRAEFIFKDTSWHFAGMKELRSAQAAHGTSFGMVTPGAIERVTLRAKDPAERALYERKATALAATVDFFRPEYKELGYRDHEIVLEWRCAERCDTCTRQPHRMQVLDWGLIELARRNDWDWQKAVARLESLVEPGAHDFKLFLGNTKAHPRNFLVVGLWYPKSTAQFGLL